MITKFTKVTIVREDHPDSNDINAYLQWFCQTLGMFNLRDKEKSCYRLFIELLKSLKSKGSMSSDELASQLNIARSTVIHHLNSLISAGLVIPRDGKYILRVDNLQDLVKLVKEDVEKVFTNLDAVAEKLDKELLLK